MRSAQQILRRRLFPTSLRISRLHRRLRAIVLIRAPHQAAVDLVGLAPSELRWNPTQPGASQLATIGSRRRSTVAPLRGDILGLRSAVSGT